MVCNHFIRRDILKYEAVYFVGDNQTINRVRVDSSKTRNRGAFSGSLAALLLYALLHNYTISIDSYSPAIFPLTAIHIFSLLINAVTLLLNCLVLVLYLYIHFLSL